MSVHHAIIGVGSNIDAELNIEKAKSQLEKHFNAIKVSHFVKTKPIGLVSQPDFLNGAVMIQTEQDMNALKSILRNIEERLGRKASSVKYGPRTIDLDIVVWDDTIIDQDFYARDFIRQSVLQLKPDLKY